jgi:predicted metal-dependent RNase
MIVIEDAMRRVKLKQVPIYIDGLIWDINGILQLFQIFYLQE